MRTITRDEETKVTERKRQDEARLTRPETEKLSGQVDSRQGSEHGRPMSVCAARGCRDDAFLFEVDGTIGLCYQHWRSLWTKTNFYDDSGWEGVPVELKNGGRLAVEARESGNTMEYVPPSSPE